MERIYTYIKVAFPLSQRTYTYISDEDVSAGDLAYVSTAEGSKLTLVCKVQSGTAGQAPYEFSRLKKVDRVIPYGSDEHRRLLVGFAIAEPNDRTRAFHDRPFIDD